MPFYVGGAEANVATALALWGIPSAYLTALPDNLLAHQLAGYLEERGCRHIAGSFTGGSGLGFTTFQKVKDVKNAGVIYDRATFFVLGVAAGDDRLGFRVGWSGMAAFQRDLAGAESACGGGL